jgi:putative (di)nucleoside polyphosphate hydrolase
MVRSRHDPRPWRPCVGLALFDADGRLFLGARSDLKGMHWQLPQGGIDPGETPEIAAMRELKEEVGTDRARILGRIARWVAYDLPPEIAATRWQGRYRGQIQAWFALRLDGPDSLIHIDTAHPEFKAWRWAEPGEALAAIAPFKRAVYDQVLPELVAIERRDRAV